MKYLKPSVSAVIILVLIILLRPIRSLFPMPAIGADKIVGYAQYFGYPLSFDTLFFFALMLIPLLVIVFVYLFKKYHK